MKKETEVHDERMETMNSLVDAFMEKLPEMLEKHEGKWTVFVEGETEPEDFWHCRADAEEGVTSHMDKPMLVRQVTDEYHWAGKYGVELKFTSPLRIE